MSERMQTSGPRVAGWVRGGMLLWLLGAAAVAPAQIRIGLKYEHGDVLQFEPVRVFVTVYNDTPDVLRLGGGPADRVLILDFQVEDRTGLPRVPSGREPLCEGVSIAPGGRHTLLLDVTRWVPMVQLQHYRVMVEGHWKGRRYESNPVQIQVVAGLVLSEIKKTVPGYEDRIRTYSLRYWRREKSEHLFLRVDELADGRNMNYGTVDIGPVIRVVRPRMEVDYDGNVKIVHQSGRDCYTRTLFRSERNRLRFVNQTYHLPNGEPYPNMRTEKERRRTAADGAAPVEKAQTSEK